MNPALRHQLASLDRTILALLDERARMLREVDAVDPARRAALADLLRRQTGPLPAHVVRRIFELVDQGCDEVSAGRSPFRANAGAPDGEAR